MKIRDEHLVGLSRMSDLRVMRQRIDRQTTRIERRMRTNFRNARETYSLSGIAKTVFTFFDNFQSAFRYFRK